MTQQEICEALGINRQDLQRMQSRDGFPQPTGPKKSPEYDLAAIQTWLLGNPQGPPPQFDFDETADPPPPDQPVTTEEVPALSAVEQLLIELPARTDNHPPAIAGCRGHIEIKLRGRQLAAFKALATGVFAAGVTRPDGKPVSRWSEVINLIMDRVADQLGL